MEKSSINYNMLLFRKTCHPSFYRSMSLFYWGHYVYDDIVIYNGRATIKIAQKRLIFARNLFLAIILSVFLSYICFDQEKKKLVNFPILYTRESDIWQWRRKIDLLFLSAPGHVLQKNKVLNVLPQKFV